MEYCINCDFDHGVFHVDSVDYSMDLMNST